MLLLKKRKGNHREKKKKVEVQTPRVTRCQRISQETTRARVQAAVVMLQSYDFRDDFSVIKSLTEGNKNPTVPSAAEKLKPCSHLFIISKPASFTHGNFCTTVIQIASVYTQIHEPPEALS